MRPLRLLLAPGHSINPGRWSRSCCLRLLGGQETFITALLARVVVLRRLVYPAALRAGALRKAAENRFGGREELDVEDVLAAVELLPERRVLDHLEQLRDPLEGPCRGPPDTRLRKDRRQALGYLVLDLLSGLPNL